MKKKLALVISAAAMLVATASSSMCFWFVFEETEMPKSLIK